ncbi:MULTISPECIES: hypothetical protein [Methanosarcina]|uniref:Uncharacterized protein n=3 Tax=Methanosarcina mazei TaxID=2209 RepID=A0A0E3PZ27_METMZ|nr:MULTISPECIES: hypothetical protein [Methanosarcina]AKB40992.1 hypothetical protein MSMAW_2001 [Methanosarcina mazei WWM610]AKB71968.1 hypothetical protein MSMAC_2078 [Methanosarcina mazei C16]MDO5841055.1 hypothetical protein [Methanosarcina mazei]MDY0246978.1 hypothetical protein [Methanosarcina mazei]NLO29172.1 hypothetical protein [Methanosarcina mazei]
MMEMPLTFRFFFNAFGVLFGDLASPFLRPLFFVFKDLYFLHILKDLLIPADLFKAFSLALSEKSFGIRISYCKIRI